VDEVIDFSMSEKFGLEWPYYDARRVQVMMAFISAQGERQSIDKKLNQSSK